MKVLATILFIMMISTTLVGCDSIGISPSPSLPATSAPVIATTTPPATSLPTICTPAPALAGDTQEPETEAPEPTPEPPPQPGVWVTDTYYGIDGEQYDLDSNGNGYMRKNSQYELTSAGTPVAYPDKTEIAEAADFKVKAGNWEYYFDTKNPVIYNESKYGYPVLRKNSAGNVESLGIEGFDVIVSPQYLYILNNWYFGDFVHWDTWRVSLDGKEKRYVGDALEPFVPSQGGYMYFSGYDCCIYRADFAFTKVVKIALDTPDIKKIEKTVEPNTMRITFDRIENGWLYFGLDALNIDDGRDYSGSYKMKLTGGKAVNMDKGVYGTAIPFEDDTESED